MYRKSALDLVVSAIERAVQYCHDNDTLTPVVGEADLPAEKTQDDVHEIGGNGGDGVESRLKAAVITTAHPFATKQLQDTKT